MPNLARRGGCRCGSCQKVRSYFGSSPLINRPHFRKRKGVRTCRSCNAYDNDIHRCADARHLLRRQVGRRNGLRCPESQFAPHCFHDAIDAQIIQGKGSTSFCEGAPYAHHRIADRYRTGTLVGIWLLYRRSSVRYLQHDALTAMHHILLRPSDSCKTRTGGNRDEVHKPQASQCLSLSWAGRPDSWDGKGELDILLRSRHHALELDILCSNMT